MTSTLKKFVESIANQKAPGPSTTFTVSHIFFALELMAEHPIGRNKLAKKLEVGEGAIRTIISRLKDTGLIETSKEGCSLTKKGFALWRQFEQCFPQRAEIAKTDLTKADYNYAFLVKNSGQKVKSGIEQRDAAIVAGATRAVIIVSKQGRLTIESVSDNLENEFPEAATQILRVMQPSNNDVIIIVGAANLQKAKIGSFAASWALLDDN
jgi:predicted transcriptional regulator